MVKQVPVAMPAGLPVPVKILNVDKGTPFAVARRQWAEESGFEADGRDESVSPFYASRHARAARQARGASVGRATIVMWCVCGSPSPVQALKC